MGYKLIIAIPEQFLPDFVIGLIAECFIPGLI